MWILLSVLMIGVPGESTSLVNLQGKWTAGLRMSNFLTFSEYSILWRPWKTVMVGIEGSGHIDKHCDHYDWNSSLGIELYKYFRAHNLLSPYVSLLSEVDGREFYWVKGTNWFYYLKLNTGVEYFFTLFMKQMSLKLKTNLVSTSLSNRTTSTEVNFYLPTGGKISTWLCFHF